MIERIWGMRTDMLEPAEPGPSATVVAFPVDRLPPRSLLISPGPRGSLSELVEQRRAMVA